MIKLFFRVYRKDQIFYSIDHQVLAVAILLKKVVPLKTKVKMVYHQLELVDINKLGKLSKFLYSVLIKNTNEISFYVFPEINRWKLFLKDVGRSIDESKFYLLPNTCHIKEPILEKQKSKQLDFLDNIPKEAVLVGHVGNFGFNHYAEEIFKAINLLEERNDIYFLFLGYKGSDLAAYVSENVSNPNVIIVDEIQHQYLDSVYQRIDIGMVLYKAIDNNFAFCAPNKLYEYWANGVPVIGSTLPGLTGVFENPVLGELVDFDDPLNIKSIIQRRSNLERYPKQEVLDYFSDNLSLENHLVKLENKMTNLYG